MSDSSSGAQPGAELLEAVKEAWIVGAPNYELGEYCIPLSAAEKVTRLIAVPAQREPFMDWVGETLKSFEAWQCEQTEVAMNYLADHLDQLGELYVAAGGKLK